MSFFASDKDLRKAVPKAVPKPKNSSQILKNSFVTQTFSSKPCTPAPLVADENEKIASGDIVALARQERALRESNRAFAKSTVFIQRWWRGRICSFKVFHQTLTSIESKLLDISKLLGVIPSFSAPAEVSFLLLKHVLLIVKRSIQLRRYGHLTYLAKYCRFLLLPSLSQLDQPSKNIIVVASTNPDKLSSLIEFFFCCLHGLKSSSSKQLSAGDRTLIAKSILELMGGGAPFKIKFSKEISIAYDTFRASLKRCTLYSFYRSSMKKSIEYLKSRDVLSAISEVLLKCTTTLSESGQVTLKSCDTTTASDHYQNEFGAVNEPDFLVAAYITFMRGETDFSRMVELLSVPMIMLTLSQSFVESVFFQMTLNNNSSTRTFFKMLLDILYDYEAFCNRYNITAYACHPHIPDSYWILGNILSFSPYCSSDESIHLADCDLKLFLSTCTIWLTEHPMNDVLLGRKGITWARSGSSMTAVALPDGLEKQVLSLLSGDIIRHLSNRYLSNVWFTSEGWDSVVCSKDMEDIKAALSSDSYVMTKSALKHVEQEKTWFTSKWARKLTSSFVETINAPFVTAFQATKSATSSGLPLPSPGGVNLSMVGSLCQLWAILLTQASMATNDSLPRKALMTLAFSGGAVERLWVAFLLSCGLDSDGFARNYSMDRLALASLDKRHAVDSAADSFAILICFVALFRAHLLALNDSELYDKGHPLPMHQVLRLVRCLKTILYSAVSDHPHLLSDVVEESTYSSAKDSNLPIKISSCRLIVAVLADLYSRWARRPFSSSALWEIGSTEKLVNQISAASSNSSNINYDSSGNPTHALLRRYMPWAIRFYDRLTLFRRIIDEDKLSVQGSNDTFFGGSGNRSKGYVVRIRRSRFVEDGISAFTKAKCRDLKDRLVIRYINDFGEEEMGIDSGGLFKDFINDLGGRIFDPSYGLFSSTSMNLLYPNPAARFLYDQSEKDLEDLYVFAGRLLGKALFENVTLQPQFAHFFLAFMNGNYNFINLIDDLATLDAELYKNLIFLKSYEGSVEDLDLTFSVSDAVLGRSSSIDLIPGGSNIAVTSSNRFRYIQLVAKYYLHDRLKIQAGAFFSGLYETISPTVLSMFCAPELQIAISGSQSEISIEDMRSHVRYAGGYVSFDVYMRRFWAVVEELSAEDRALLLKFVTSCERPPSLGFVGLQPPFTIQKVEYSDCDTRLPTASTCFNILKLPTYSSQRTMKEKLLLAIRSKAGFDLS